MRDIYLTMVTHPREPEYFSQTIKNLVRSGLGRSTRLWDFKIHETTEPANINVSNAIAGRDFGWVLFIEDDLDFCDNFVDSCAVWLDDHYDKDIKIYSFGCTHPDINDTHYPYWQYPINIFNGTQCFAIRASDAQNLSQYLVDHCYDRTEDGTAYDLLMADWARSNWPEQENFLASRPAFVQHIGVHSVIRPRPNVHTFESFPGQTWSYV